eukprot:6474639-Amphidinium_carterae.1
MRNLAIEATKEALDKSFRRRRKLDGGVSWWSPIDDARRKAKKNREKAAVFANLASGCWWTTNTMFRRGLCDSPACTLCGCDLGGYEHRLLHCIALRSYREQASSEVLGYLQRLSKDGPLESQLWAPIWPDMLSIFAEDAPVRCIGENAPFKGRIYTDGSAIHVLDAQCRRAGWAVVSIINGSMRSVNYGAVPLMASVHQTSRDAEDMAFAVLLGNLDPEGHHIVGVDCKGTIGRARRGLLPKHILAKDVRSHLWVNVNMGSQLEVRKVKAHCALSPHMTQDERLDTIGNALADEFAKKGALEHVRGGTFRIAQYHALLRLHTLSVTWAADLQYRMWKDEVCDHPPLPATRARGLCRNAGSPPCSSQRKARKKGNICKWDPPAWLVALSQRALHEQGDPDRPDQEALLECVHDCVPSLAHDVHAYDVFLHGVLHGSILACVRCGAYATSAPRLLGKRCEGDPAASGRKGLEQQLRRIRSGRIPRGGQLTVSPR